MTTYYKAVRPDGTGFRNPNFRWVPEGWTPADGPVTVTHPDPHDRDASGYLSVATVATDCTGMEWPCRLLLVEPGCDVRTPDPDRLPHKRGASSWVVVGELPAHEALGPQGNHVARLVESVRAMTPEQVRTAAAARDAVGVAAWGVARVAAWDAVVAARHSAICAAWSADRNAARASAWFAMNASGDAAGEAAEALAVRDLITTEHYDILTRPLRLAGITVHPDDPEVTR